MSKLTAYLMTGWRLSIFQVEPVAKLSLDGFARQIEKELKANHEKNG